MNGWNDIPCGVPVMVTMKCSEYYPYNFVAPFIGVDNDLLVLRVDHVWQGEDDIIYDAFPDCVCKLATFEEVKAYDV